MNCSETGNGKERNIFKVMLICYIKSIP